MDIIYFADLQISLAIPISYMLYCYILKPNLLQSINSCA